MNSDYVYRPARKKDGEIGRKIHIALTNAVPEGRLTRTNDMLEFWNKSTGKEFSRFSYAWDFSSIDRYALEYDGNLILFKDLVPDGPLIS